MSLEEEDGIDLEKFDAAVTLRENQPRTESLDSSQSIREENGNLSGPINEDEENPDGNDEEHLSDEVEESDEVMEFKKYLEKHRVPEIFGKIVEDLYKLKHKPSDMLEFVYDALTHKSMTAQIKSLVIERDGLLEEIDCIYRDMTRMSRHLQTPYQGKYYSDFALANQETHEEPESAPLEHEEPFALEEEIGEDSVSNVLLEQGFGYGRKKRKSIKAKNSFSSENLHSVSGTSKGRKRRDRKFGSSNESGENDNEDSMSEISAVSRKARKKLIKKRSSKRRSLGLPDFFDVDQGDGPGNVLPKKTSKEKDKGSISYTEMKGFETDSTEMEEDGEDEVPIPKAKVKIIRRSKIYGTITASENDDSESSKLEDVFHVPAQQPKLERTKSSIKLDGAGDKVQKHRYY